MTTIILKDGTTINADIRDANQDDIPDLMKINHKWQKEVLGENTKNGFVGAAFSKGTFSELIRRRQVVIVRFGTAIIGYYLLNNFSKDGIIGKHEGFVNMLKKEGKIFRSEKVCVGAQAVVDSGFMGSGIRTLMLNKLVSNMKEKYSLLFATIAKDNPRAFKAHTRDGWDIVGEEEALYYVVYKV